MMRLYHFYGDYPRLTRTHTVLTGRKAPIHPQRPCQYTKYSLRSFRRLAAFLLRQNCFTPDSDGFSSDFWLLRRRCVVTHQDEKARPFSRTPSKAQRSGFVRKKEEGASIVQFSPKGGNGMTRTSLLPRPLSKAQRSGFARKKEEGESIMEFSPQGGNGMTRTSSDASGVYALVNRG